MSLALSRLTIFCILCVMLCAACATSSVPTAGVPTEVLNPVPPTATFTASPPTPEPALLAAPGDLSRTNNPQTVTLFALDDLVTQKGIPREAAQLVRQEEVTWENLECRNRSGGTIDGYKLLYLVGDTVYEYHTDRLSTVKLCDETNLYDDYPDLVIELDPTAAEMVTLSKRQVERDFDVLQQRITLVSVHPEMWQDTSLGCPVDGQTYTPMEIGGYEIRLRGGGNTYVFHSDYARVTLCEE